MISFEDFGGKAAYARRRMVVTMTGTAIFQKYASLLRIPANCSKFCPKYPVKKVRGRKNIVTKVSCLSVSFWFAADRLNIRSISASTLVRSWSSDYITMMQLSSTSPRYV